VVAGASESDERGRSAAPEPFSEPVVNGDGGSGRGKVLPEPGVKDNHRSGMTEFFPESDAWDGGGSGMKEFFPESDACDGGGSDCGEVSPAFSIKVRVLAYCRFDWFWSFAKTITSLLMLLRWLGP
jgi:hypothetical protein